MTNKKYDEYEIHKHKCHLISVNRKCKRCGKWVYEHRLTHAPVEKITYLHCEVTPK